MRIHRNQGAVSVIGTKRTLRGHRKTVAMDQQIVGLGAAKPWSAENERYCVLFAATLINFVYRV